ncbi:MAG: hypothetical protein AUK48_09740 [Oscillatoriales cyanobacterium CG2_30_44_21]|nr:MAG: hypothetical protein AUK48_09740 [Oscillatoriales cyanobacterium CG2_30_44_21]
MLKVTDLKIGVTLEARYKLIQKLGEGGTAVIWEVEDLEANGDRKAIKVCNSHAFKAVMLLRQEFSTIQRLQKDLEKEPKSEQAKYIVQVETLYPLKKPHQDDRIPLHFFVMERIVGCTLESLILKSAQIDQQAKRKNLWRSLYRFCFYRYPFLRSQIPYSQIANWLAQLTEALQYLHSRHIIYCDLKPANIMITNDGNIKLIDFGAVILTEDKNTYQREVATRSAQGGFTFGYVAPEQMCGQALPQSDFYSLGQTLLFALTGLPPSEISVRIQQDKQLDISNPKPKKVVLPASRAEPLLGFGFNYAEPLSKQSSHYWRSQFPSELSNFLLKAINDDPLQRHRDVEDLSKEGKSIAKSLRSQFGERAVLTQMLVVAGIAAIATASTLGLRSAGVLQTWELQAYDQIVRMRPDRGADPRLLIIDVPREIRVISDQLLVDILSRLKKYHPRVIGIPLIRDQERPTTLDSAIKLQKIIQKNPNIFGMCVHSDSDGKRPTYPFLPKITTPIGFINSHEDPDKSPRRHLLMYREMPLDQCPANISFALLIAHQYLQIPSQDNPQMLSKTYRLGKATFHSLELGQGAYQDRTIDYFENVFQIMIDYRSPNIDEVIPVSNLLEADLPLEKFRDRLVLIGRASINRDATNIKTPYGSNVEFSDTQITSQIISQLINVAEGKQPILSPATFVIDLSWILILSSLSAFLGWRITLRTGQFIVMLSLLIFIYLACFYLFIFQGLWLGLVPMIISSVVANLSAITYTKYQYKLMERM